MILRKKHIALLFAAMGAICCGVAHAQIAPGPISKAHADLGGLLNCTSCHGLLGRGLKCLNCHVEIKHRVEANTGFHARAYKSSAGNCASCHAEHRGRDYVYVPLDRQNFDHRLQTGFTLEGRHREQKCENCHNETKIPAAARSEIQLKDLNRSFLGLDRECTSCHQEPHEKQLGADCNGCHTFEGWKPASKFSHSRTAFPLTGRHQEVPCQKCHSGIETARGNGMPGQNIPGEGGSNTKLVFKDISFSGCQSCHTSPHSDAFQNLKLKGKCEACHNTGGWKNNRPAQNFNHNLAKFSLVGKHADLSCDKCHKNNDFGKPIAHRLCADCHEDPHAGQFASRAAGSDCSACHSPSGFKPSLFDRQAHQKSPFPLKGKHMALECAKCHQPEGRETVYRTGKPLCASCHTDPHGGDFASGPYNNQCDQCHSEAGFEKTSFTVERHARTRFPLTGQHAGVACQKCHKPLSDLSNADTGIEKALQAAKPPASAHASAVQDTPLRFRSSPRTCESCHTDPHKINPKSNLSCETCHIPQRLDDIQPFDHSRAGLKLEGAHLTAAQSLDCIQCHKPSGEGTGIASKAPVFSKASAECSDCHSGEDPHGGQFNRPADRRKDCSSCHLPTSWSAGGFDHDSISFILSGAHRAVDCTKCHTEVKGDNGKMVRLYRGTPVECLGCH